MSSSNAKTGFYVAVSALLIGVISTVLTVLFWDSWGPYLLAYLLGMLTMFALVMYFGGKW